MLLQLDDAIEASIERLQRSSSSSSSSSRTKDIIPVVRNEAINATVLGKTSASNANATKSTEPRSYAHVTVTMAHGNTSSATVTSSLVPPRAPATSATPTEHQPARKVDILIYPTVSPETIVVPILSCIVGFPIFALLVICCLRRRAKIARERDRRRNFDLKANTITLVRFNSHHLGNQRSILLQSRESLSRGYPSLDLDTVYEEKSDTHGSSLLDSPAAHMLLTDPPSDTDNEQC